MATIDVVKSGIGITLLNSETREKATPMPNRAMPIGNPIASTDPKAMIKMMTAARMP